MWDAASGQEVVRHEDYASDIAFSPDGEYLATSADETARVWDVTSGQEVARITHDQDLQSIAFSPDGEYLATASKTILIVQPWWKSEDLTDEACARLTRNLTVEEWQRYVGDEPYRKTCPNLPGPKE